MTESIRGGFYIILAAQFFSALADNCLLFAAIALARDLGAPQEYKGYLQQMFVVSYVVLAPFVGAFADSMPKGRVMFISNAIKLIGCIGMLAGLAPLLAYGVVGLGAAAYAPAKYGILTEYLPPEQLVWANGWLEGLTVGAIILGAVGGSVLVNEHLMTPLLSLWDLPGFDTGVDTAPELAIAILAMVYVIAAVFNLYIPKLAIDHRMLHRDPWFLIRDFLHAFRLLWTDRLGRVSLAVTTAFWGAGATLRLIVVDWADKAMGYGMEKATLLTGAVAVGIAFGAYLAAKRVKLEHSVRVLPVGIAMGVAVCAMVVISDPWLASAVLVAIGVMGGYFVVPMNALLQHRGHLLMGAGHSIAVQNFNENASILAMLGGYTIMVRANLSIYTIILVFGVSLALVMAALYRAHGHAQD